MREWWLPDPVVNIDIGQSVSDKIVEEGEIEKSSFLPIFLGVAEDIVQGRHEEDVSGYEDEERNWENISELVVSVDSDCCNTYNIYRDRRSKQTKPK